MTRPTRPSVDLLNRSVESSPGHNPLGLPTTTQRLANVHAKIARSNVGQSTSTLPTFTQQFSRLPGNPGSLERERDQDFAANAASVKSVNSKNVRAKTVNTMCFTESGGTCGQDQAAVRPSVPDRHMTNSSDAPRLRERSLGTQSAVASSGFKDQTCCPSNMNGIIQTIPNANGHHIANKAQASGIRPIRRPRVIQSSSPVHTRLSVSTAALDIGRKQSSLQQQRNAPENLQTSELSRPNLPQTSRQRPQGIYTTGKQASGQELATRGNFGFNGPWPQTMAAQVGSVLSRALSAISGIYPTHSGTADNANVVFRCLVFAGKQLSSTRRLLKPSSLNSLFRLGLE